MRDLHEASGAVLGTLRGVEMPRRYDDPAAEYAAATDGLGVRDRSHRVRLVVRGRQPGAMLAGIVTGRMPAALAAAGSGDAGAGPSLRTGRAEPQAVLTPKGRVVTDLRLWRADEPDEAFVADVPAAGAAPLADHLKRFLPPRFAAAEDVSAATGMLTVLGPGAAAELSRLLAPGESAPGAGGGPEGEVRVRGPEVRDLGEMSEGDLVVVAPGLTVLRTVDVAAPAWDVVGTRALIRGLWQRLLHAGARPVGSGVWEALRIEAGRPAFGSDMDTDTLLPETGLEARVVDPTKGCYTGQEVVVRIRDRGHVNRHLRRLVLGDAPSPGPGAELFAEGRERPVGHVTSAAASPRRGTIALGYVRREVEPGGAVRVGAPAGPEAVVEALG